ncbi:uncharacterized protein LOC116851513 [Odontomachus brunneus]|uniref:uncharacterized protein LOC116851513 n=1 Tax=Odontomachus brunneus TaxID=486640 RepID=UPI0013F26040|nr:uncharacterized protein LOC116851513 [Odontomachus brunneus]
MWKIITRGIRETFERRACRTNVYSQPSQDNAKNEVKTNVTCQQSCLAPIYLGWNKGFCGSAKSADAKDKERDYKWDTRHSWPEAIGWSSILAVGWVVCQSLCLQKRVFDSDKNDRKRKLYYTGVNNLLTQIKTLQFKSSVANILPVTKCVNNSNNSNLQNSHSQWHTERPFGPLTMEEALKEATDEFKNIHKIVLGEYEFRYGIKALEEKRYKDAWTHFSRGAKLSSPGSMFNLALCYELGIGTLADLEKAAKYYNDAADYDHAEALYNLGVYHAQGKGGLPVDIDTARTCFTRAAKLGQVQAQRALDLEKANIKSKDTKSISTKSIISLRNVEINEMSDMHEKLIDKMTNFIAKSDAPEYNEEIARDSARVLMDILGLKEPQPAIVTY